MRNIGQIRGAHQRERGEILRWVIVGQPQAQLERRYDAVLDKLFSPRTSAQRSHRLYAGASVCRYAVLNDTLRARLDRRDGIPTTPISAAAAISITPRSFGFVREDGPMSTPVGLRV